MRARLKKKAGGRGGAQPPPRGGLGGAEPPPHLQMVEILVGILIHSNTTSRRSDSSGRRRYSD